MKKVYVITLQGYESNELFSVCSDISIAKNEFELAKEAILNRLEGYKDNTYIKKYKRELNKVLFDRELIDGCINTKPFDDVFMTEWPFVQVMELK